MKSFSLSAGLLLLLSQSCNSASVPSLNTSNALPLTTFPIPSALPPLPSPLPDELIGLEKKNVILTDKDGKSVQVVGSALKAGVIPSNTPSPIEFHFEVTKVTTTPPQIQLKSKSVGLYISIAHTLTKGKEVKSELKSTLVQDGYALWDFSYEGSMLVLRDPFGYYLCRSGSEYVGKRESSPSCKFSMKVLSPRGAGSTPSAPPRG